MFGSSNGIDVENVLIGIRGDERPDDLPRPGGTVAGPWLSGWLSLRRSLLLGRWRGCFGFLETLVV